MHGSSPVHTTIIQLINFFIIRSYEFSFLKDEFLSSNNKINDLLWISSRKSSPYRIQYGKYIMSRTITQFGFRTLYRSPWLETPYANKNTTSTRRNMISSSTCRDSNLLLIHWFTDWPFLPTLMKKEKENFANQYHIGFGRDTLDLVIIWISGDNGTRNWGLKEN